MRPIDADRLKENHPMAGYYGYKQEDIDAEPTLEVVSRETIKMLGDDLRLFQAGIKSKHALIGFNAALALCNKWLGHAEKELNKKK